MNQKPHLFCTLIKEGQGSAFCMSKGPLFNEGCEGLCVHKSLVELPL